MDEIQETTFVGTVFLPFNQPGILGVYHGKETMSFGLFTFPFHVGDAKQGVQSFLGEGSFFHQQKLLYQWVKGGVVASIVSAIANQKQDEHNEYYARRTSEKSLRVLLKEGRVQFKGSNECLVFFPKHVDIAEGVFDHRLGGVKDPSFQ